MGCAHGKRNSVSVRGTVWRGSLSRVTALRCNLPTGEPTVVAAVAAIVYLHAVLDVVAKVVEKTHDVG